MKKTRVDSNAYTNAMVNNPDQEIIRLLNEGYTEDDIEAARTPAQAFRVSLEEYLHRYVKPTNKKRRTKADGVPIDTGTVIAKPGTVMVDIETSALTLMRCKNIKSGRSVCCAVMNTVLEQTTYTDPSGKPLVVIPEVLYNVLVQLLYSANYRVQQAEKDLQYSKSETQVYKTLVDTLRVNGVID